MKMTIGGISLYENYLRKAIRQEKLIYSKDYVTLDKKIAYEVSIVN